MNIILFTVISFCCFISKISSACDLVVRFEAYSAESMQDENNQWHGIDVDFAKMLLNEAQCRYRFVNVPWNRGLELLKLGEIDMMLSVSPSDERARYAGFIGPQRVETIVLATDEYFNEKLEFLSDLKSLSKPVAIHRGAYYGETFDQLLKQDSEFNTHFINVTNNKTKLLLLRKGRIAGFLEEKYNVEFQAQFNPIFKGIVSQPLIINSEPVYIAISKRGVDSATFNNLQNAFQRLKKRNAFNSILAKYNVN